jgi:histidine triad (HIT) family protein
MSTESNPSGSNAEETVFMKIIRREIPVDIIYEDEHTLAFLDIAPNSPGHTLVIPKKPFQNIFDVDQETLAQTMETVRKVAPAVRDAAGAKGVHVTSNHGAAAGQEVFHLHFHIIPRHDRSEFEFWPKIEYSPGQAAEIAEKMRNLIS